VGAHHALVPGQSEETLGVTVDVHPGIVFLMRYRIQKVEKKRNTCHVAKGLKASIHIGTKASEPCWRVALLVKHRTLNRSSLGAGHRHRCMDLLENTSLSPLTQISIHNLCQ
jgi:hypothetical protein